MIEKLLLLGAVFSPILISVYCITTKMYNVFNSALIYEENSTIEERQSLLPIIEEYVPRSGQLTKTVEIV